MTQSLGGDRSIMSDKECFERVFENKEIIVIKSLCTIEEGT